MPLLTENDLPKVSNIVIQGRCVNRNMAFVWSKIFTIVHMIWIENKRLAMKNKVFDAYIMVFFDGSTLLNFRYHERKYCGCYMI